MSDEARTLLDQARAARHAGNLAECLSLASEGFERAQVEGDQPTAFHSLLCAGRAYHGAGENIEALRLFTDARDYANSVSSTPFLGMACHDRFLAAKDAGADYTASQAANAALEVYTPKNRRLPALIADMALCEMGKDPGYVLHAWLAFYSESDSERDRLIAAVNILDAASRLYSDKLFRTWLPSVYLRLDTYTGERHADVLLQTSQALLRRDKREEAYRMAERALWIATARGEAKWRERAEELLSRADGSKSRRGALQ